MARREDELRETLRRELQAAREQARERGGDISPDLATRIERLARLLELERLARAPMPRRRWPLGIALLVTLGVASALLFARVRETEIELEVAARALHFVLPEPQVLTELVSLDSIAVSGLKSIRLGGADAPSAGISPGASRSLLVSATSGDTDAGVISLDALALPADARVRIEGTHAPGTYRLGVEASAFELRLSVRGAVSLSLDGASPHQRRFGAPSPVHLSGGGGEVDIDLELPEPSAELFARQLRATALSFHRFEQFHASERTLVRHASTIESGSVYLEAIDGVRYPLRAGEALRFERVEGIVRRLALEGDRVRVEFRGQVRGMNTGWGAAERSLMPSYLEWLEARHGLYLLWGTTLYVFGLIAALLRWWGGRL